MKETTSFSHTGNIGDIWASIPAMKEFNRKTGKKITLYLAKDIKAFYYEGAVHPTKSAEGHAVMLNEKVIEMMKPLLLAQPFIEEVKIWDGEKIQIPLEVIRDTFVGMPSFSINRWYFYVYPDLACDLSQVWLNVPETDKDYAKGKIIVTRSERYRNEEINFNFLKPYEDKILFCGTMREYNNFCMSYDLNVKKFHIDNFLELAQAIQQCDFHITNQTQAFQLSEGLKKPRILELCRDAPNCIPIGEKAFDYFSQYALEWYFHLLNEGNTVEYMKEIREKFAKKKPSKETA